MAGICLLAAAACGDSAPSTGNGGGGGSGGGPVDETGGGGSGPEMPDLRGTVVLTEVAGKMAVEPGGDPEDVRLLAPLVTFGPLAKHDYDDVDELRIGCIGNHYDLAKGDVPTMDVDAGVVTLTGYKVGTPIGGNADVPSEIQCAPVMGAYKCGFGPVQDGAPGPNPQLTPFPDTFAPIEPGTLIEAAGEGGEGFGSFDSAPIEAADTITLTEDLTTIAYDPKEDLTLNFTCPGDGCGVTALTVYLQTSQLAPEQFGKETSPTSGSVTCTRFATGSFAISKGAIAAALGCDADGENCDPMIRTVRALAVRLAIPDNLSDDQGHPIRATAGGGVFGFASVP